MMLAQAIIAAIKEDRSSMVFFTHVSSPFVTAYSWTRQNGFGTKYTSPSANGSQDRYYRYPTINSARNAWAAGYSVSSPYIAVYPIDKVNGFGTKFANPSVAPGANTDSGPSFNSKDSAILITTGSTSPYIAAWIWNNSTGFGTKYSNPGTLISNAGRHAVFSPTNKAVFIGQGNISYPQAYAWTDSGGFGTKYTNPSGTTTGSVAASMAVSHDGTIITTGTDQSPYQNSYPFNDSTGFGTRYATPGTLPFSAIYGGGVAWSKKKNKLFQVGTGTSPYIAAYVWSNGYSTKFSAPSTALGAGGAVQGGFSSDDQAIAMASSNTPWANAYRIDDTAFGTKYSNPSSLPTSVAGGGLGAIFN